MHPWESNATMEVENKVDSQNSLMNYLYGETYVVGHGPVAESDSLSDYNYALMATKSVTNLENI